MIFVGHLPGAGRLADGALPLLPPDGVDCVELKPAIVSLVAVHVHHHKPGIVLEIKL